MNNNKTIITTTPNGQSFVKMHLNGSTRGIERDLFLCLFIAALDHSDTAFSALSAVYRAVYKDGHIDVLDHHCEMAKELGVMYEEYISEKANDSVNITKPLRTLGILFSKDEIVVTPRGSINNIYQPVATLRTLIGHARRRYKNRNVSWHSGQIVHGEMKFDMFAKNVDSDIFLTAQTREHAILCTISPNYDTWENLLKPMINCSKWKINYNIENKDITYDKFNDIHKENQYAPNWVHSIDGTLPVMFTVENVYRQLVYGNCISIENLAIDKDKLQHKMKKTVKVNGLL